MGAGAPPTGRRLGRRHLAALPAGWRLPAKPARLLAALASAMTLAACSVSVTVGHQTTTSIFRIPGGTGVPTIGTPTLFQAPQGVPDAGFQPLHVAGSASAGYYIADASGRQVFMRGVAAVGLEDIAYRGSGDGGPLYPIDPSAYDGRCPAVSPLGSQGPLCEVQAAKPPLQQSSAPGSNDDFAEMRSLGIDTVRLVLDWSELEPQPGVYSTTFLDRIAQVVGWAQQQGIGVILDMHEDQYSRFVLPSKASTSCAPSGGYDGAPLWATFTDGEPACEVAGQSDLNPAVAAAFDNFWHNRIVPGAAGESPGRGLEDHYIGALAALARRFDSNPAVIGYEIMNEPLPGAHSSLPLVDVPEFSATELYPFYRRAIEAITGVRDGLPACPRTDPSGFATAGYPYPTATVRPCAYPDLGVHTTKLLFFEPCAYRNLLDFSPQQSAPFSAYKNLVFAPHVYTHAFTVDSFLGETPADSSYPPSYDFGYQTAAAEARAMGAAVLVTEFGDNSGSDGLVLAGELAAQDRTLTSGTLWAWAGNAQSAADCWCVQYRHSSYQTSQNGLPGSGNPHSVPGPAQFIASRVNLLEQPYPQATEGTLDSIYDDPASHTFAMTATQNGAVADASTDMTVVYLPSAWKGAKVTITGSAKLQAQVAVAGAELLVIAPGAGRYEVTIASPGSTPAGVAAARAQAALRPLPAISYQQALATVTAFVKASERSPDPKVRASATLLAALAKTVLGVS
jgi:hypothetical protein